MFDRIRWCAGADPVKDRGVKYGLRLVSLCHGSDIYGPRQTYLYHAGIHAYPTYAAITHMYDHHAAYLKEVRIKELSGDS